MIELTIKTLDNQNRQFTVEDETTVGQLKEKIREEMDISLDLQRLIFCGKPLKDDVKLSEYGVHGNVIHLVPRPPRISLSGRPSSQRQQAESGDNANRQGDRVGNRPASSPVPRVTFDPPSDAVLEQQHQATLTPTSGRVDFVNIAMYELKNTLDYVAYYHALGASTNVPVVRAEDESVVFPMEVDQPDPFANEDRMNVDQPRPSTSASRDEHINPQPSTSAQSTEVARSQAQADTSSIPPVPYRRAPRPPSRPVLATPSDLANVLEELSGLEKRFEPYKAVYCSLLRDRSTALELPSLEVTRRQALMEMMGDFLHTLGHIYHALSDIELNIGDYANKLTTDPVTDTNTTFQRYTYDVVTPAEMQAAPVPHVALFRRANMPSFTTASSAQPNGRPQSANGSPQASTSADSIPFHQVQASVPVRRVDTTMLIQDMMANMQNAFQQASNQQAGQAENQGQHQQNRGTNPGQTGQTQGPGSNQGQTESQGDNRPRFFMEIENLVRTLTQGHPGIDVVMSMEEVQPLGSPLNIGPPDIFPSDPQNEAFLFDMNAAIPVIDSNNASLNGSPTGGNENSGANAGIRFVTPGGGTPRFNIPGFTASFGVPEGTGSPAGVSISAVGPTTFQIPDGGVFVSPMGAANSRSDAFQTMINNVFRANNTLNIVTTANGTSTSTTPGTNTTANTASATANNTTNTTTTSASPVPNAVYTINPTVAANVGAPFTIHSHITYRLTPEMGVGHQLNIETVPGGERSASTGATRRTTSERRRVNREINRSPRMQSLNNLSNMRAHQLAQNMMVYDRYLMCNNVYANERLSERRFAYQEQHTDQMSQRMLRNSPTGIDRLEQANYNFTTRHMACMMRLLSGPISPESRLNAFMVTVARQLHLDQQGRACSQHPPIAPQEFIFVRMHMRDYLRRIVNQIIDAGARDNLFDQTAAVILGHSRTFINQMEQFTLISTAAPPMDMLRARLRFHMPRLLACILSDLTSDSFAETFYVVIERFYTELCAYIMSFCVNGFEGFRNLYTAYIEFLTENFEETSREWVRLLARENLIVIQSMIDPMTPASFVYQRTRAQRQSSSRATPPPPPARNDTPDTLESLPSVSIPTMSLGSLATDSPSPPEVDIELSPPMFSKDEPASPPPPGQTLPETAATSIRCTRSTAAQDQDDMSDCSSIAGVVGSDGWITEMDPEIMATQRTLNSSQESERSVAPANTSLDYSVRIISPPAPEMITVFSSPESNNGSMRNAGHKPEVQIVSSPPLLRNDSASSSQILNSRSIPSQDIIRIMTPPLSGGTSDTDDLLEGTSPPRSPTPSTHRPFTTSSPEVQILSPTLSGSSGLDGLPEVFPNINRIPGLRNTARPTSIPSQDIIRIVTPPLSVGTSDTDDLLEGSSPPRSPTSSTHRPLRPDLIWSLPEEMPDSTQASAQPPRDGAAGVGSRQTTGVPDAPAATNASASNTRLPVIVIESDSDSPETDSSLEVVQTSPLVVRSSTLRRRRPRLRLRRPRPQ